MTKISVILPTYNERENLPLVINKVENVLNTCSKKYEIIVVDDNSPDKTYTLAKEIASKKKWLRVIHRIHDRGLSSAIIAGFSASKGDYLIVMDSDMQHDENILPEMIDALGDEYDIVIGSRKAVGGGVLNWSRSRKLISKIASLLAKIILPSDVKDPMSGYFGLTREAFEKLAPTINPRGFKILMELIVHSSGLRIKEIGYIFRGRQFGKSKFSTGVILSYLISIYELSVGRLISLQFLKYSIVGLSGVVINQWGLWLGVEQCNLTHKYSLILGIELSILTNFVLNNYWTFKEKSPSGFLYLLRRLFLFNFVCLTGAVINYSVAIFFEIKFGLSIYWGNLIGIVIATAWNYIINVKLIWDDTKVLPK